MSENLVSQFRRLGAKVGCCITTFFKRSNLVFTPGKRLHCQDCNISIAQKINFDWLIDWRLDRISLVFIWNIKSTSPYNPCLATRTLIAEWVFSSTLWGANYFCLHTCMSVCLFVCLSVCLFTRITRKPHGRTSPIFVHVANMAVAWSCSDSVAIRFLLPVFWMTSCFHTVGPVAIESSRTLCLKVIPFWRYQLYVRQLLIIFIHHETWYGSKDKSIYII